MVLAADYTFGGNRWIWYLVAAAVGALAGYVINGWRKSKWVDSSSTSTLSMSESDELGRLRGRVANLEPIVADRDTLRKRVVDLEARLKDCEAAKVTAAAAAPAVQAFAGVSLDDHDVVVADRDRLRGLVGEHEASLAAVMAERDRLQALAGEHQTEVGRLQGLVGDLEGRLVAPVSRFAGVNYDFDRARDVLGERIKLDDLKVVEGIGPKIEELCHGGGVTTWAGLADTPVSRLQEILDAAGERFRIHNPTSWPQQAELLALGKWEEFKDLTDRLTAGRDNG